MKRKQLMCWLITIIFLNPPFIISMGTYSSPLNSKSSYMVQDNAGLISTSAKDQIISINNYLENKNSASLFILTFDEDITGNKEYFINNYKRTQKIDSNTFIIAIFPNEIVINVGKMIKPYFSDLLIEGFQRKIIQGRQNGNLDDVLLEITQKVQQKLKQHGWADIQLYKIKCFFKDFLVHIGISTDSFIQKDLMYVIKYNIKEVERALE